MNKNNNERNNYKGRNTNFNGRKRSSREPKVNLNEIKVPLQLPGLNLDDLNITHEIFDVLAETKFNKISIPLGTYRYLIDSTIEKDDNRICTIGYIRDYDVETDEFTVIIFDKFINLIKDLGDIAINLVFTRHVNSLGTITKFNIAPAVIYNEEGCVDCDEIDNE